jgi:arylsulfatase
VDENTARGPKEEVATDNQVSDETTDIGRESGTPVSADYDRHNSVFTGKVNWVQIDLGKDDHDHFISAEERLNLAMARQ